MFIAPKTADVILAPANADPDAKASATLVCETDGTAGLLTALDRLSADGGKIYIATGTIQVMQTIAREIDNVTIEGAGRATHIYFDGVSPVISAGTQSGWNLLNFDTDAGGVDVNSSTESVASYWRNGVRVITAIDPPANGENLIPSAPPAGSLRIKNLYVTPDLKIWVDYDDDPV